MLRNNSMIFGNRISDILVKLQCEGYKKNGERCSSFVSYNAWSVGDNGMPYCHHHRVQGNNRKNEMGATRRFESVDDLRRSKDKWWEYKGGYLSREHKEDIEIFARVRKKKERWKKVWIFSWLYFMTVYVVLMSLPNPDISNPYLGNAVLSMIIISPLCLLAPIVYFSIEHPAYWPDRLKYND